MTTFSIMKPGAYISVTNMHAEMGTRSQAGFTDQATGVKIQPTSYVILSRKCWLRLMRQDSRLRIWLGELVTEASWLGISMGGWLGDLLGSPISPSFVTSSRYMLQHKVEPNTV